MNQRRKFSALAGIAIILATLCLAATPCPAVDTAPDYAQAQNWVQLPRQLDKPVDVFWLYPTIYNGEAPVAAIDDPQMLAQAKHTLAAEASVFEDQANIFAPLYRQNNISVLHMEPEAKQKAMAVGVDDCRAALNYYLDNQNGGRPFILAGFSQGANNLLTLLDEMGGDPRLKNLVAAYVVGWSVTADDLKRSGLDLCRAPESTGCIISYNSVAEGCQGKTPTLLPGALAVNPLSWGTGPELAPASLNMGAVFIDNDGKRTTVPHFTSAQIKGGALVVKPSDPELLTALIFGPGVYHAYEFALYYNNLKENAAARIRAFQKGSAK